AMRGRKPKPVALKMLTMTATRAKKFRTEHTVAVAPLVALVDAPEWLSDTQKTEWSYVIENAAPGVLKRIDRAVVVAFCVAADIFRQAAIMQSKTGLLVKGRRDGDVIPSPLLRIMRGQAIVMFKAAEQLGFSPVARARIRSDAPPVADDGGWSEIS